MHCRCGNSWRTFLPTKKHFRIDEIRSWKLPTARRTVFKVTNCTDDDDDNNVDVDDDKRLKKIFTSHRIQSSSQSPHDIAVVLFLTQKNDAESAYEATRRKDSLRGFHERRNGFVNG